MNSRKGFATDHILESCTYSHEEFLHDLRITGPIIKNIKRRRVECAFTVHELYELYMCPNADALSCTYRASSYIGTVDTKVRV